MTRSKYQFYCINSTGNHYIIVINQKPIWNDNTKGNVVLRVFEKIWEDWFNNK
uniref:Uncharacterized protein n=1 Tax=viral metagenome TaxID=1070528 RepID=A0A6C0JXF7_9ZZZZ